LQKEKDGKIVLVTDAAKLESCSIWPPLAKKRRSHTVMSHTAVKTLPTAKYHESISLGGLDFFPFFY
jgi:hypothetical protein